MKFRSSAMIVVLASAGACLAFAQSTVTVSTTDQLVRAIGSNRTIVMKAGTYLVGRTGAPANKNVRWDQVGEAWQLVVNGVSGLTIKSSGGNAKILGVSQFITAMAFEDCSSVTLSGLTAGHQAPSECQAGVLGFTSCENVTLQGVTMTGSGSFGITLQSCQDVNLVDCVVTDCTSGAAALNDSNHVRFADCTIEGNAAYPLFFIQDCDSVRFDECGISENSGQEFVSVNTMAGFEGIGFYDCTISSNAIDVFTNSEEYPDFETSSFSENQFGDPAEGMGEGDYSGPEGDYSGPGYEYGFYDHPSGLCLLFPPWWTSEENEGIAVIYSNETDATILFFAVYDLPKNYDARNKRKYFDEGLKTYLLTLKSRDATVASIRQEGDFDENEDFISLSYRGSGMVDKKKKVYLFVRFVMFDGRIYAISGSSGDEGLVDEGSELYQVLESTCVPKG
ncbi:MAG: right-handed parallel beta-helix repeat-containing protein [Spirochaetes bacterium]|nr:right-handed parallel beta-helix repeat-containing protein [Spirochaetota bacterium]